MGLHFNLLLFLVHVHICFCSGNVDFNVTSKHNHKHPINTNFQFPSPLPTWPQGGGFGSGEISGAANSADSMPDLNQIQALIQEYSPRFYFHPEEQFYPSTVNWFFENGALLYTNGQGSVPISPDGSNLPQGGSSDDAFWIDLPTDGSARDMVKQGGLQDAGVYIHAKPALGSTHTDLAIWVFYPFNGGGRAKVAVKKIDLGKIGQHVGDWEHVTLRINNLNGALESVFFSQHAGGEWVDAPNLEYFDGNKFVVYSSLHGHAAYPTPGDHQQGGTPFKLSNLAGQGDRFLDTSFRFTVISAPYLGSAVVEPPWLNYAREWGPTVDYDLKDELDKVRSVLPWLLKKVFDKAVKSIPHEVLYEEGPTGPKFKGNWDGVKLMGSWDQKQNTSRFH